jgi:hypothetical protein
MDRANQLYPDRGEYVLSVFDIGYPGVAERLHRERAAWQEHGDIKVLDKNHFVLIVHAGRARRATS